MQLGTERLVLRELVEGDARALFAIESDVTVTRYLSRQFKSLDETEEYLAGSIMAGVAVPRLAYDFAVTVRGGDDALIGRCGMKRGDSEPREAMIWYVLAPAHQGNGYATEATRALIAFAFETLGLHRVYADLDPRNPSSVRVLEKLGLRKEAHHVENVSIYGEWCDTLIYAMLRREHS